MTGSLKPDDQGHHEQCNQGGAGRGPDRGGRVGTDKGVPAHPAGGEDLAPEFEQCGAFIAARRHSAAGRRVQQMLEVGRAAVEEMQADLAWLRAKDAAQEGFGHEGCIDPADACGPAFSRGDEGCAGLIKRDEEQEARALLAILDEGDRAGDARFTAAARFLGGAAPV
jgi:hypothetical protein